MNIKLLDAATATNSAPSGDSAGASLRGLSGSPIRGVDTAAITVASTAGSGTMTVTIKIWVYTSSSDTWSPLGTNATAATKGILNEGNALEETESDTISHTELVEGLAHYDRIYGEITAIGGTATAISMWIHGR